MHLTMMGNKTEWAPERGYTTQVHVWENDLIVRVTETDGLQERGHVEVWMNREQLVEHIATLQASLELPQINHAKVSSETKQEVKA